MAHSNVRLSLGMPQSGQPFHEHPQGQSTPLFYAERERRIKRENLKKRQSKRAKRMGTGSFVVNERQKSFLEKQCKYLGLSFRLDRS